MKIRWFYKQFTVYMLFIDTLWRFFPLLFRSWPTVVRLRVRCVTVCWGRPRNELQLFSAHERSAAATVLQTCEPSRPPVPAGWAVCLRLVTHSLLLLMLLLLLLLLLPGTAWAARAMGMSELQFNSTRQKGLETERLYFKDATYHAHTRNTYIYFELFTFFCSDNIDIIAPIKCKRRML